MKKILRKIYHLPRDIRLHKLNKIAQVHPNPVFVIGNQRSGTSAIGSLLAELTGKSVAIDMLGILEPTQQQLHRKQLSFSEFVQRNKYEFSKDIIKEPSLTFLYEDIVDYFPNSKFVFILRDPRDNIRSILNRVGLPGHQLNIDDAESRRKLSKVRVDWEKVIDSRWLGADGVNYIEWMAHRWNIATDIYKEHATNMVLIRYEDFIKDKVWEIEKLADDLGLNKVNDITNRVDIQYQPAGNRSVSKIDFFGEQNLKRIESICKERMEEFDYPVS